MYKENGRLNISVAGTVSDFTDEGTEACIIIDGEKVRIKPSSSKLLAKIKKGSYVKLECYLENGKLFASSRSD